MSRPGDNLPSQVVNRFMQPDQLEPGILQDFLGIDQFPLLSTDESGLGRYCGLYVLEAALDFMLELGVEGLGKLLA